MQITSLSVGIRRINENNPNQQGAIPKNSLFQPRQNRFVYRTTRQRNPIPFRVRLASKAISLNPRPQRKQGARVLYNDVEFSRTAGTLVDLIYAQKIYLNIPSLIRQYKVKILNFSHSCHHAKQHVDALSMPDLRAYIVRDANGAPQFDANGNYLLSPEGNDILNQCCLIYLGYVLSQLQLMPLTECCVRSDENVRLDFFSCLLPNNECAINMDDEFLSLIQVIPMELSIPQPGGNEIIHKCNYKVVFAVQQITTNKGGEKKLVIVLKTAYLNGNRNEYMYPAWNHQTNARSVLLAQKRLAMAHTIFGSVLITKVLREWYKRFNPALTDEKIKDKICEELSLSNTIDIYYYETVFPKIP